MAHEHGVHPTTMRGACKGITWQDRDPLTIEPPANTMRIPGYSAYFADIDGNIFSARQSDELRQLTLGSSGRGLKVFLVADGAEKGRTTQVHDLVCSAWHGERPSPDHRVLHADDDRINNKPANLSWTASINIPRQGGGAAGEAHGRSKLTDIDVLEILAYGAADERPADIARRKGIHPTTVSGILQRRLWSHVEIPEGGLPEIAALERATRTAPSGEMHGRAKLSQEQVTGIRTELGVKGNATLALEYGVHPTTISRIRSGQGWNEAQL